ncbi:S24/S26 family peptidase [Lachnospiraceae bacterium HCP28S3_F9]
MMNDRLIMSCAYMDTLRSIVQEGKEVSLIISGNSMAPFLKDKRDYVLIGKPTKKIRVGDIAFFQRSSGQYIMHRVYKIKPEGYYFLGDAQKGPEGPINKSNVFAIVKKVKRNGKWIDSHNIVWHFYSNIWIRIVPFRGLIYKLYKKCIEFSSKLDKHL